MQQRFRRLGRKVGHVEEGVLGRRTQIAEPVGRNPDREQRCIVEPGKGQPDGGLGWCCRGDSRPHGRARPQ